MPADPSRHGARRNESQEAEDPGSMPRQAMRRLVPYRVRWLAKVTFKRVTGLYYRDLMRASLDNRERIETIYRKDVEIGERLQAQEDMTTLLVRRVHAIEDNFVRLAEELRGELAAQRQQLDTIIQRLPQVVAIRDWEPWLTNYILVEGDTFVDIGASTGQYAANLASGYRTVIAFEPNPQARDRLRLSVSGFPNVSVDDRAVSSRTGAMKLYLFPDHAQSSCSPIHHEAAVGDPIGELMVPCVRLDDVPFAGQVDFVKIDTEGAEVDVIAGGINTISQHKPRMLIEVHSKENGIVLQDKLEGLGYQMELIRHPSYAPEDHYWEQHYWLACQPLSREKGRQAVPALSNTKLD